MTGFRQALPFGFGFKAVTTQRHGRVWSRGASCQLQATKRCELLGQRRENALRAGLRGALLPGSFQSCVL